MPSENSSFLQNGYFSKEGRASNVGDSRFRNPFDDYASRLLPEDMNEAIEFSEFMWYANPTFSRACSMVARYFITELSFDDLDDQKKEDYKDLLLEKLDIVKILGLVGDDTMCYSNGFYSIIKPFNRALKCPDTGSTLSFRKALLEDYAEWKDWSFKKTSKGIAYCDGEQSDWEIADTASDDVTRIAIKRWRPQEIDIKQEKYGHNKTYFWRIPSDYASDVKKGDIDTLEAAPVELIEACKNNKDARFRFNKGELFHASDETVSGVITGGWGIPLVIRNFRAIYRAQLLDRYDEAINLDYMMGLRAISPETGGTRTGSDPIKHMGMQNFAANVKSMIDAHRQDPTTWHTSSVPLRYQHMGADGTQLTPVELKDRADANVLNSIGVPEELYRMNLSVQAAPLALRLFEKLWPNLRNSYNRFLNWIGDVLATNFKYPTAKITLIPPTLSDDLTRKDLLLQLMGSQQVSPQTALEGLGLGDYREELRKLYESERIRTEEERKYQEEQEQEMAYQDLRAQLAGMGAGGAPLDPAMAGGAPQQAGQPGPGAPQMGGGVQVNPQALQDPMAMQAEAARVAQELLIMDPSSRRSTLTNLTKQNNTFAAVVKEELRKLEQGAAQAGIQAARAGQM